MLQEFDVEAAATVRGTAALKEADWKELLRQEGLDQGMKRRAYIKFAAYRLLVQDVQWQFAAFAQVFLLMPEIQLKSDLDTLLGNQLLEQRHGYFITQIKSLIILFLQVSFGFMTYVKRRLWLPAMIYHVLEQGFYTALDYKAILKWNLTAADLEDWASGVPEQASSARIEDLFTVIFEPKMVEKSPKLGSTVLQVT